jgi:hypothetical protein
VEALRICPYARQCRETGKLHRRVLSSADDAPPAMREIEALPKDGVEVALLIFPSAPSGSEQSARDFESLCAGLRPHLSAFYCVAFHPDLPPRPARRAPRGAVHPPQSGPDHPDGPRFGAERRPGARTTEARGCWMPPR